MSGIWDADDSDYDVSPTLEEWKQVQSKGKKVRDISLMPPGLERSRQLVSSFRNAPAMPVAHRNLFEDLEEKELPELTSARKASIEDLFTPKIKEPASSTAGPLSAKQSQLKPDLFNDLLVPGAVPPAK